MDRKYMSVDAVNEEMQKVRNIEGFSGDAERAIVSSLVASAKANSRIGGKIYLVVPPMYIHFPKWQRCRVDINHASRIGTEYNEGKWDPVKVFVVNGQFVCFEGMHRVYGTFLVNRQGVLIELLEISLTEAIYLFLSQGKTRYQLKPTDYIRPSLVVEEPEYVAFQDICHTHNVTFLGMMTR